ncbi:hypothetical protein [Micromonospora peucetia]|uniref:Uncharacterized protein n=1 Tax=Micromonospora peucetia TaxID=47871 RepID=A0A1C6U1X0_9ACTN|nr:hypothetical protein [Micromonospora peucetia]WSA33276.1 hypothetical protein OIE14_04205 [Micromonospora peucetia]SCL47898.1 hypothetical protein GA0070608_0292 [Micromonospora peucetia]
MSQPPTGPEGYPPYPPYPPAGPGQQPSGGAPPGTTYGSPRQYSPEQPDAGQQYAPAPPAPQQYNPAPSAGYPQSAPPSGPAGYPQSAPPSGPSGYPQSAPPASPGYTPGSASPAAAPHAGQVPGGPAFGQPMSVPPASGPAYGQPMSAPPGSAPPFGAPVSGGAGKSHKVLVLALVAGLLFVLGGVMTGLYVTTNSELGRTEKKMANEVSQRDGTITANGKEIEKLKADLQGVRDKLGDTEQDLTGTRNDRDEQARQKKVIANCLDKLTTALAAAANNNKAAYDKAIQGMDKVCNEAEKYL